MNPNEGRTLWLSVAAALLAVFLLYSYTQEKSDQISKEFGTKDRVVQAVKDINEMQTIDETMLKIVERPSKYIHEDSIKDPQLAVGKVALAPIKKDEIILKSKILTPGPVTGLSLQVNPGKRAITLPVDDIRGVARLLKPGDHVDILAALDVGTGFSQAKEVRTIMQDVVILATGLRIANELPRLYERVGKDEFVKNIRSDTSYTNITVEVSAQDAQKLVYIMVTAPNSMYLTLRYPEDGTTKIGLSPTSVNSLRNVVGSSALSNQVRRPMLTPPKRNKK